MKYITFVIPDGYADIMSFCLIGADSSGCNATGMVADSTRGMHFVIAEETGKIQQMKVGEDND